MLYAYAAILEGVPFANGAPNLTVDIPVLRDLAIEKRVPISGKDFKTGQTLIKTVIGPMLRARMLGLSGWYSTNILGNRDGEVLDDPDNFKTKEESKLGVLEHILDPETFPELYGDVYHKVRINYYPPRGDNKEGWDNIDIKGWLGYPMQIKINFLCRDSILAAPIVLDLAIFLDLAQRAPMRLSIGQRKRVALATVLAMNPSILVFDEPSAGLDPRGRRELIELLQSLTQTLIVSTHDLELARAAFPRSIVVDRGAIVADGSTSEILANRELLLTHGLA